MKLRVYQIQNQVSAKHCWIAEVTDNQEIFWSAPSLTREQALCSLLKLVIKVSFGEPARRYASPVPQQECQPLSR